METKIKVKLVSGEKDGDSFDMPADWDPYEPPLHTWVVTALGEWELADCKGAEPDGLREQLTTCAYRFADDVVDDDGEVLALVYERDVSADRTANR